MEGVTNGVAGPWDTDELHGRLVDALEADAVTSRRQPEARVAVHLLHGAVIRHTVRHALHVPRAGREAPRHAAVDVDGADLRVL